MTTEEKRQALIGFCHLHDECEQPGFECPLYEVGDCAWEWDKDCDTKYVEACYNILVEAGALKEPDALPNAPEDMVNHPNHYTRGGIECIDALNAMVTDYPDAADACLSWQVVKYIWRHPFKGKPLEDLKKAQFYLSRLIKREEAENENSN